MLRAFLTGLVLATVSLTCIAQRHSKKHPQDLNLWPTDIPKEAHLRISLRSNGLSPTPCHLVALDADRITCSGTHHTAVSFDRNDVASIEWPHHPFPAKVLFFAGDALVISGGGCSVDNGPACIAPVAIGLAAIAGSIALHFVHVAHNKQTPYIYVAPPLTPSQASVPSQP